MQEKSGADPWLYATSILTPLTISTNMFTLGIHFVPRPFLLRAVFANSVALIAVEDVRRRRGAIRAVFEMSVTVFIVWKMLDLVTRAKAYGGSGSGGQWGQDAQFGHRDTDGNDRRPRNGGRASRVEPIHWIGGGITIQVAITAAE